MNAVYLKNPLVIAAIGGITLSIIMYMKNKSSKTEKMSSAYYIKVFAAGAFASGGMSYGATFLKNNKITMGSDAHVIIAKEFTDGVSSALPNF